MLSWTTDQLHHGIVADPHVPAQGAVPARGGFPEPMHAVVADDRRSVDGCTVGSISAPLPSHTPGPELEPADCNLDVLVEDVLVGLQIGLEGAHVLPVAVGHVSEQGLAGGECLGNESLEKSTAWPSGMKSKISGSST